MIPEQIGRWSDFLHGCGLEPGEVLGSGMEGAVVSLGDDRVAKIWHRRPVEELAALQRFYSAVGRAGVAVATPSILQILSLDGQHATIEPRLHGRPLWTADGSSPTLGDRDVACIGDVLAALAAVEPAPDLGILPVLEGEAPFQAGAVPFPRSLAALVARRVERFRAPLLARLPELDLLTAAVVARLEGLEPGDVGLVHGDLIPANIFVDDTTAPQAVLDFGFLTTLGDPAFDAAVTASIYDMYGPRAAETEATLDEALGDRFGHDPARLAVYRAAYALATGNCFSASGSDGHFEWCMRVLERPAVREALDL